MKGNHSILSLILLCTLFFTESLSKAQNNYPYIEPTPGEITIMAISPVPLGSKATRQAYEDVVECGFNMVSQMAGIDYFKNQMNLAKGLDLKFMISNSALRTDECKEYIEAFKNNPQLGGWLFIDEPKYDQLQNLGSAYKRIWNEDPKNLVFFNLIGALQKPFTGPFTDYSQYLKRIQDIFQPAVWSFDYYPFMLINGKLEIKYDGFFNAMEKISSIAKETQRPFWSHCQGITYKTKTYSRPAATEEFLKFANFSALAYGAQGIVYWAYSMRNSSETETYISALVDMEGNKYPAWHAAKKVNAEIKKFKDVFYKCDVLEVRHTGDKIYKGTKKLDGAFGPLQSIRSGKSGVLVSHIANNNENYIVIVSHDVVKKQKVSIELKSNVNIIDITVEKNKILSWKKDHSFTLSPGSYKILKVIKE